MSTFKKTVAARRPLTSQTARTVEQPANATMTADPLVTAMQQASAEMQKLLTPAAVSELLGVAERTLERWRITGEGPRYVKLTRKVVRYLADDVATFVAERVKANTAQ